MICALRGHMSGVQYLIEQKADLNAIDNDRDTALILAANRGFRSIVRLLIDGGADKTILGSQSTNAAQNAFKSGFPLLSHLIDAENTREWPVLPSYQYTLPWPPIASTTCYL